MVDFNLSEATIIRNGEPVVEETTPEGEPVVEQVVESPEEPVVETPVAQEQPEEPQVEQEQLEIPSFEQQFKQKFGVDPDEYNNQFASLKEVADKFSWLDEGAEKLLRAYKENDLVNYLQATQVDWDKVPDAQIVRDELRKANPTWEDDDVDFAFNRKYGENEDDPDASREARLALKSAAAKARSARKESQANYTIPEYTPKEQGPSEAERAQMRDQWIKTVESDPATAKVKSGAMPIKIDDETTFNLPVNADELLPFAKDEAVIYDLFRKEDGNVDLDRFYLTTQFAKDPHGFVKSIWKSGESAGMEKHVTSVQKPSKPPTPSKERTASGNPLIDALKYGEKRIVRS